MRVEVISGSARTNSQTKRVAMHLHKRLQKVNEVAVGLINLDEFSLGPVENVFQSASAAPAAIRHIVERMLNADAFILVSPEYNGSYSPKHHQDHLDTITNSLDYVNLTR